MAITNPAEAITSFVTLLRQTIACITQVPVVALPTASDIFRVAFVDLGTVEVQTAYGTPNVKLSITHDCRPISRPDFPGAYTVRSVYYSYEVLDLEETEILTYHWHPTGVSPVTHPHLHLSSQVKPISVATHGRDPAEMQLADIHIPTGWVLLEDVVRMLIEEFKVRPLTTNWEDTLALNTEFFRENPTW